MRNDVLQRWTAARAEELPGAHITFPFGPEHRVFRIRDKMFMMHTEATGEPIVLLKARPADAEVLRRAYTQITPGWHMNKRHWITLNPGDALDRQIVEDLVTESYLLVVEKLPRSRRPVDPDVFGQADSERG